MFSTVARLKRASGCICEKQEQERTALSVAPCHCQERRGLKWTQPSQLTESRPALATDDEPEMNAGGADVAIPLAAISIVVYSATVSSCQSRLRLRCYAPRLTVKFLCIIWLTRVKYLRLLDVTQLNGDLRSNTFPDRSISEQHTFVISNTGRKFVHGISTQPPILPAISDSWIDTGLRCATSREQGCSSWSVSEFFLVIGKCHKPAPVLVRFLVAAGTLICPPPVGTL
ncbi:hypothetical protein DFJ58DRAFT_893995 [Suillus subalutaceus]|uniref:uncharacterized protein n=1 Tax=Suillus subalutaceus TaxID=48586 RepID=UPI001B885C20|nr:uncharacterized protein DFJ58DRAFT_893995 [Suillus subalutaceus]KAG1845106.1 hypothetical protein DFJ58DRAFT_893995 [Suillus subalutaceus]